MKIAIITGTRAEFFLLKNLILALKKDKFFELNFYVTGSHLSKTFGNTIKDIKKFKIKINKIVDIAVHKDSTKNISNSISIGINKFSKIFHETKPDLILILGDRYEILSCAISANINRIPIAHIHGGERTEGLIDEGIRHAITKLSHIHFVTTKEYYKRVIQLGENSKNVHNVGALGVELIHSTKLMNKSQLEKKFNVKFKKSIVLITYHPETLETKKNDKNLKCFFSSLKRLKKTTLIFTMPNADIGFKKIVNEIEKFVRKNENSHFFKSLGQVKYYSICNLSDFMIGNSSSGIIEMPSFKKPTINLGKRQQGRLKPLSVLDCDHNLSEIISKIKIARSKKFLKKIKNIKNPYYFGETSKKILNKLKKTNLNNILIKKFNDQV